jgi:trimeric autotransporter adhesin
MRLAHLIVIALPVAVTCNAQQYVLSTFAGGVPPATPATATEASIFPPSGVAVDSNGNVFFSSAECVFRIDPSGTMTRVAGNSRSGFTGDGGPALNAQIAVGSAAHSSPGSLTIDGSGNLYTAELENYRVRKISTSGIITTIAGRGHPQPDGDGGPAVSAAIGFPTNVAVDGSGNVFIADQGYGLVRKVSTSGIITTVAGGGTAAGTNGAQATSIDITPMGVAVDASGDLFISGFGHNRILKVAPSGVVAIVAGTGTAGFSGDGGPATAAQISQPTRMALDSAGNLYFVDARNSRVRSVSTGGTITTVAGGGTTFPADSIPATQAGLPGIDAIAVDAQGNLYLAASWIQKVTTDGIIHIIGGNGTFNFSGNGAPATAAQLWEPGDVALGVNADVMIADTENQMVRHVDSSGVITTVAGNGNCAASGDGGMAVQTPLCSPGGVAVDRSGNLFVSEPPNNRIRKVTPAGIITTVAVNGVEGSTGDGGPATSASLAFPLGVAVDGSGNLFIADYGNNRIRKVTANGVIGTVAGTGVMSFSGDGGPAASAELALPTTLAVDAAGNLFIADTVNNRVRKVSTNGVISTFAGNGQTTYPGDGGQAVNAGISQPQGVALDGAGNVFISTAGGTIYKVSGNGAIARIGGLGQGGVAISGDGVPASTAALGPAAGGLRADSAGRVYFADNITSVRLLSPVNQSILIGAVVDAASQSAIALSPGKIVVIYGVGMGPAQLLTNLPQNGNESYSTQLAGTMVSFSGIPAPLLYTSSTQVAAIVPYGVSGSTTQVVVSYQGAASSAVTVPVAASAPSLFSSNGTGAGQAAAVNLDNSLNDAAHPVAPGGYLSLYATGEGQTTPAGQDGKVAAAAPPLPAPQLPVSVTVGGQPATVLYAGAAPGEVAGLMQVVIQIPANVHPGGYVPVVLQVGAATTVTGAAWIAVSAPGGNADPDVVRRAGVR